jgi:hypothetical protein
MKIDAHCLFCGHNSFPAGFSARQDSLMHFLTRLYYLAREIPTQILFWQQNLEATHKNRNLFSFNGLTKITQNLRIIVNVRI